MKHPIHILTTLLLLALLAGCAVPVAPAQTTEPAAEATTAPAEEVAADTRIFVDDLGNEVEIPVNPQRIVALHDVNSGVPLLSLGAPVVSIPMRGDAFHESLQKYDLSNITSHGQLAEPSVEAIAALEPDLIVGQAFNGEPNPAAAAGLVEPVAPTVWISVSGDHHDAMARYGDLLGKSEEVERQRAEYEAALERLRTTVGDLDELSYSLFAYARGEVFVWSPISSHPIIRVLEDLGVQTVPVARTAAADGLDSIPISPELISDTSADIIFAGDFSEDGLDDLEIWQVIPAVASEQTYPWPDGLAFTPAYTELMAAVAVLEPILTEADASVVDESDWE